MSGTLTWNPADRLLLLAPHPDDETLAAGGLLQRVSSAGAPVRVLFATDGENNPWTQRVVERRLRIRTADRRRFGARRRAEALAALACLGVDEHRVVFLGLPDQGLTDLVRSGQGEPVARIAAEIAAFAPQVLAVPSIFDLHPDHSALAVLARLALARLDRASAPASVLTYLVHRIAGRPGRPTDLRLLLTDREQAQKAAAIRCHATQLAVHPRQFMSFAGPVETFAVEDAPAGNPLHHPIRAAAIEGDDLCLEMRPRARAGAFGRATLSLVAVAPDGARRAYRVDLSARSRGLRVVSLAGGTCVASGSWVGGRRAATLRLSLAALRPWDRLFVKLERRFGFFDEAGWREIPGAADPAPPARDRVEAAAAAGRMVCCIIPCFNVAAFCGEVVQEAARHADRVIAVDDGSTDGTGPLIRGIAARSGGRVSVLTFPDNRGKGAALIEGLRAALSDPRVGVVVTLDGDGQHRPADIPRLLAAWRGGADLVIGARALSATSPLRSRIGNGLITLFLRRLYARCPNDTQSGFRVLDRRFAALVVERVAGARYETETHMLLLALDRDRPIATVTIPTIYTDGNRSSHYRPLSDSVRIGLAVLRWKMSGRGAARAESAASSATTPSA